jgi:hypothetical protein
MINKKNRVFIPTRINNYNKFLITLDNNYITHKTPNYSTIEKNKTSCDLKTKYELDNFIEKITNNFKQTLVDSSSFTGQTVHEIFKVSIELDDPNYYKDIRRYKHFKYNKILKHTVPQILKTETESSTES